MVSPRLPFPDSPFPALKLPTEFSVSSCEVFRKDACLTDGRHEVGITAPTREHMNVNVIRDARTCHGTEVHADIESGR